MADTFSNPGNAAYFADLGITIKPARVQHGATWRPHPILRFIPVIAIPRGQTGWGHRAMADFSAAIAFAENTALTDQAMPTITSTNPTLVGRGFSFSQTVQGRQRVADADWPQAERIREEKVIRVLVDDLTHLSGNANSIIALSASITDVTTDAAGNASLDGLLECIARVGRPAVALYDAIGIRGIFDSIRAEGSIYANDGVTEQVRRLADKFTPDMISDDGFVVEIAGCRIYQVNEKQGDATRLYENSSITHGLVMADIRRRAEAARGGSKLYQFQDVLPPIVLQGRANAIPDLPRIHEGDPNFLRIEDPGFADVLGVSGGERAVAYARWLDVGNNVAGYKWDFGGEFDPLLTNGDYIRCHQYLTTYQT